MPVEVYQIDLKARGNSVKLSPPLKSLDPSKAYAFVNNIEKMVYVWIGRNINVRTRFLVSRETQNISTKHGFVFRTETIQDDHETQDFLTFITKNDLISLEGDRKVYPVQSLKRSDDIVTSPTRAPKKTNSLRKMISESTLKSFKESKVEGRRSLISMGQTEQKNALTELKSITKVSMDKWYDFIEKWRTIVINSAPEETSDIVLLFSELRSKILTITENLSAEDYQPKSQKTEIIGRMRELSSFPPTRPGSTESLKPPPLEETLLLPSLKERHSKPDYDEELSSLKLFPPSVKKEPKIQDAPETGRKQLEPSLDETSMTPQVLNVIINIFEKVKQKKSKKILLKTVKNDLLKTAKQQGLVIQEQVVQTAIEKTLLDLQEGQFLNIKGNFFIKTKSWSKDRIIETFR